jgi:hypothetical protein
LRCAETVQESLDAPGGENLRRDGLVMSDRGLQGVRVADPWCLCRRTAAHNSYLTPLQPLLDLAAENHLARSTFHVSDTKQRPPAPDAFIDFIMCIISFTLLRSSFTTSYTRAPDVRDAESTTIPPTRIPRCRLSLYPNAVSPPPYQS